MLWAEEVMETDAEEEESEDSSPKEKTDRKKETKANIIVEDRDTKDRSVGLVKTIAHIIIYDNSIGLGKKTSLFV